MCGSLGFIGSPVRMLGSLVARLFLAFETTVISYDPYVRYIYDNSLRQTPAVELVRARAEAH